MALTKRNYAWIIGIFTISVYCLAFLVEFYDDLGIFDQEQQAHADLIKEKRSILESEISQYEESFESYVQNKQNFFSSIRGLFQDVFAAILLTFKAIGIFFDFIGIAFTIPSTFGLILNITNPFIQFLLIIVNIIWDFSIAALFFEGVYK